jgi:hypothetical protein
MAAVGTRAWHHHHHQQQQQQGAHVLARESAFPIAAPAGVPPAAYAHPPPAYAHPPPAYAHPPRAHTPPRAAAGAFASAPPPATNPAAAAPGVFFAAPVAHSNGGLSDDAALEAALTNSHVRGQNRPRATTPPRVAGGELAAHMNGMLSDDAALTLGLAHSHIRGQNRPRACTPPRSDNRAATPPRRADDDKTLETRAARLAPRWEIRDSCMGCDCAVGSGFFGTIATLSTAVEKKHHCRACGWVVCGKCCPSGQSLPLPRWVSSTKGHPVKTAAQGGSQSKQKQVCKWCLHDQPGDAARAEVVRHQQQQATRVRDMRQSQLEHDRTMAQLL